MLDKTGFELSSSFKEHHPQSAEANILMHYVECRRKAWSALSSPTSRTALSDGRLHGGRKGLVGAK